MTLLSETDFYIRNWCGNKLSTYFSSPPTRSFWRVELGPQVRPFFLLVDRSSFLHTALRPHVLLPSIGVTEQQQEKPIINSNLTLTFSHRGYFTNISGGCTHILLPSVGVWPPGWQVGWCSHSPESSSCPHWETPGLWSYAQSLQVSKERKGFLT